MESEVRKMLTEWLKNNADCVYTEADGTIIAERTNDSLDGISITIETWY